MADNGQFVVYSGSVTTEELAEEFSHDRVCVLSKPVSLQLCTFCSLLERSSGQPDRRKLQEPNSERTQTQTRVWVASTARYWRIEPMRPVKWRQTEEGQHSISGR